MAEKEFDQLTPEEKKARFQKAFDDYNSGFVEVDYALRSVASIRVEEALEDAGRGLEEFKPAQRRVLFEGFRRNRDSKMRKESGNMARKSRYLGYMKGLQKISKHERTSTKESLLDKLRSMKNREFTINIPVREGVEDEH